MNESDVSPDIKEQLLDAIRRDDVEALDNLIPPGPITVSFSPLAQGGRETLLHIAAKEGTPRILDYLIERGYDIDAKNARFFGQTSLQSAVNARKADNARYLLEHGVKTGELAGLGYALSILTCPLLATHFNKVMAFVIGVSVSVSVQKICETYLSRRMVENLSRSVESAKEPENPYVQGKD